MDGGGGCVGEPDGGGVGEEGGDEGLVSEDRAKSMHFHTSYIHAAILKVS